MPKRLFLHIVQHCLDTLYRDVLCRNPNMSQYAHGPWPSLHIRRAMRRHKRLYFGYLVHGYPGKSHFHEINQVQTTKYAVLTPLGSYCLDCLRCCAKSMQLGCFCGQCWYNGPCFHHGRNVENPPENVETLLILFPTVLLYSGLHKVTAQDRSSSCGSATRNLPPVVSCDTHLALSKIVKNQQRLFLFFHSTYHIHSLTSICIEWCMWNVHTIGTQFRQIITVDKTYREYEN
jgi:hypothetical protein